MRDGRYVQEDKLTCDEDTRKWMTNWILIGKQMCKKDADERLWSTVFGRMFGGKQKYWFDRMNERKKEGKQQVQSLKFLTLNFRNQHTHRQSLSLSFSLSGCCIYESISFKAKPLSKWTIAHAQTHTPSIKCSKIYFLHHMKAFDLKKT